MIVETFEYGIIGMGPAGIGAATVLAEHGLAPNTICFEQGQKDINDSCACDDYGKCCGRKTCMVISGVGGASNYSSGKISDYPAGSGLVKYFGSDNELVAALNRVISRLGKSISLNKICIPKEIIEQARMRFESQGLKYKYYDVYEFQGSEYQKYITETILQMEHQGLTIRQNAKVIAIDKDSCSDYYHVKYRSNDQEKSVMVHKLVIATGALSVHDQIVSKIEREEESSYEIGVRVEAPSKDFGDILASHGDLKLKDANGRTYCVTEKGTVITYRSEDYLFLEGCKPLDHQTSFTNLAVLVKRSISREFDDFLYNYKALFNGIPIKQRYSDYLKGIVNFNTLDTTCSAAQVGDINRLFPQSVNAEIKQFLEKMVDALELPTGNLTIIAPELKLLRAVETTKDFEVERNVFVIGAATGKFRGILQSLCSGIRCGEIVSGR